MTSSAKGLSDFVAEATEILETLNRDLSILDQRRGERLDPGLVNGIFRSSHSLKGLAAMFGEQRIAQLAHHTEDLLDRLRLGRLDLTNLVVDALLESFDAFQVVLRETERRSTGSIWTLRCAACSPNTRNTGYSRIFGRGWRYGRSAPYSPSPTSIRG